MRGKFPVSTGRRSLLRVASRDLRRRSTDTEETLWEALRGRRLRGLRFKRQHPIDAYVVDFYCFERRLIVEVDGEVHDTQREYDAKRDRRLSEAGLRTLRFTNEQVRSNLAAVLQAIAEAEPLSPPLPLAGEGVGA